MKSLVTVMLKELRELLRDRRTLFIALVMGPLLGPVFFAIMMGFIITKQLDNAEKPLLLPVVGAEHAPNLVGWLKRQGVLVLPAPLDPASDIRDRKARAVLIIPADYGDYWRRGETAQVQVLFDSSDQDGRAPVRRTPDCSKARRQHSARRIAARGCTALLTPVWWPARPRQHPATGRQCSASCPTCWCWRFPGRHVPGHRHTAGERERQSWSPCWQPGHPGADRAGQSGATFGFARPA